MKKLRYLIMVVMLAMAVGAMAETQPGIIVRLKDGSTVGFTFESKPKILPRAGYLYIVTDKESVASVYYNYSEIASIYTGDVNTGGVESPMADAKQGALFHIVDNCVEASGLMSGDTVTVYTIDGRSVCSACANTDNETLQMAMPASGVYIMRTSTGVAFKFIIK